MALIDFTLSNAKRFYSSMGNPLGWKGLIMVNKLFNLIIRKGLIMVNIQFDYYERFNNGVKIILCGKRKFLLCSACNTTRFIWVQKG